MKLGTINDLSQLKELLDSAPKVGNRQQSAKSKPKPVKQKADKNKGKTQKAEISEALSGKKMQADDKKLESVTKMADEYIYSSDRNARYAGEIVEAAEQKDIALSILKHLNAEAEKKVKSGMPKIKRSNLFKLAIAVGAKSFDDEDVKKSLRILLYEISDRCQDDFIRFETKKENFDDSFLQYMPMVEIVAERFGMADFMEEIRQIHKDSLCAILKDEKVLEKYEALFADYSAKADERAKVRKEAALKREEEEKRKEAERKHKAKERAAAKAKADAEKENKNKKDTVSENGNKKDETKTAEGNNPKPIQPKKGAGKMTEENEFTPSEVQKEACKKAGIEDIGRFKDESSLIAALKENGYEIKNNEVLPINSSDGNGENNEKAGKEDETGGKPKEGAGKEDKTKAKEGDTGVKEGETDDKDKPMEFNTGPVKEKEPETKEEAPEIAEWVKEKRVEYQKRFENKEIAGYEFDPNEKVGFAAHVEGGYIHYTNKYSVTVSPDSKLKVFEALVTEGHNKGRPVNFGPNLEHKQAVLLFAACVLHGNKIGAGAPEISQADLDMIKEELVKQGREEDWNNFTAKIKEMTGDKSNENKDNKENKENKPKAFDEETKGKIKEALEHQYKLSALEAKGVAVKDEKGDIKKADSANQKDYEEYVDLKNKTIRVGDKEISEKDFLAEKFKENPAEVRAIVGSVVEDMHKEKIDSIKKKMAQVKGIKEGTTQLDEHNDRAGRVAAMQEDMAIALGIKDPEKGLTGDALKEYISKNNISQFTYARLLAKENEGKAPDQQKKANDTVYNMCNKTSAILTKDKENGGK